MHFFKDRHHAGETLADALLDEWKDLNPIVIALPGGGVSVAYPIARQLGAPLDVLLVRDLVPTQVEMTEAAGHALLEVQKQEKVIRGDRMPVDVRNRPVILVDEGLATGSVMLAAVASLKSRGAAEIAVVVPVAAREAVSLLEGEVDRVYTAHEPALFGSVGDWYEDFGQVSDQDAAALLCTAPSVVLLPLSRSEDVVGAIQLNARPFLGSGNLEGLIAAIQDKRVVMLGEATHGTAEFYRIRAALSEILIRDHGFSLVAVEGDWPDATRLRHYTQASEGSSAQVVLQENHRWPRWMWANREMAEFAETLKRHRAAVYGLDVYSLFESMEEVLLYLKKANPFLSRRIAERYACFNSFGRDEIAYAKSLLHDPDGCQAEVVANLNDLLQARIVASQCSGQDFFDAAQNARIAKNAENYYRTLLRGDASSWNVRDQHMHETLELLLAHHGRGAKAIVWAHNTHVGDYRATDMLGEGYVNLGRIARQRFGAHQVALVGFGTYQGKLVAGHAWGAPEEEMNLPPAKAGSIEECFHLALEGLRMPACYLVFDPRLRGSALSKTMGHRAVGVVYDPSHERRGHYVPTALAERYDAFVFVDQTTAIHPLHGMWELGDIPETWPMGQ